MELSESGEEAHGQTLTFTCDTQTDGNPSSILTYQYKHNGSVIHTGTSDTMGLTLNYTAHDGFYTCSSKNHEELEYGQDSNLIELYVTCKIYVST